MHMNEQNNDTKEPFELSPSFFANPIHTAPGEDLVNAVAAERRADLAAAATAMTEESDASEDEIDHPESSASAQRPSDGSP
jgi:hypothetical protein